MEGAHQEAQAGLESGHQRRRAKWAVVIGAILVAIGLLLVATNAVFYYGSWPDERPVYLAGIGNVMLFLGIIMCAAGSVLLFLPDRDAWMELENP